MAGDRQELVGVFRGRAEAEVAAEKIRAVGVPADAIFIERHEDTVASLRGEMREELDRSLVSPQAGLLMTKRAMKGVLAVSPVFIVLGIVLALPFAFVSWGYLPLWARLIGVALIGATFGGTVGFIVGAGEAEKGASAPLAAEQGVTLRVGDASPEVQRALAEEDPLRLDVVASDGTPLGAVTSESERDDEGVVEDLQRAWDEPNRG